ncbi:MAG: glycosyltransferase [Planctomycetota bacterium]|jgi:glycosyltransferase involved in cell wall biosynthesis
MHIVKYIAGITPPPAYGGIERLGFWIIRELVKLGHKVTVITDERSTIGEVLEGVDVLPRMPIERIDVVPPPGERDYRDLIPKDADVVHFHATLPLDALPEVPYLVTEHGNRRRFRGYAPNTVFVSKSHAYNHQGDVYVYNGIPIEEYPLQTRKDDFLLFMAVLGWRVKNAKTAIHLSFDSGMPVKLAGGELWRNRKMWGGWMLRAPFKASLIDVVGNVGGAPKLKLLRDARLLFYLVNWEEPFALAAHEALACGTPVLASPNGALPEYLRHGENGFVVSSYREALAAVRQVAAMGPEETAALAARCRESAYPIENTARGYLELYERVAQERWLYPPERARALGLRPLHSRRIRRYPFMLG